VYVDEKDQVWLSDFGANAVVLFQPEKEHLEATGAERTFARSWAGRARYGRRNREPIGSSSTATGHDPVRAVDVDWEFKLRRSSCRARGNRDIGGRHERAERGGDARRASRARCSALASVG
jgi:hypothetical protein